jgi:hypothetical protein
LSIKEELRRAFELASLRREAEVIRTSRQRAQVTKIKSRCLMARIKEVDLYTERYATRVEVRRRELIDKAGLKDMHFKPSWPTGADRFDPEATLRQAQRDVRQAHAQRMMHIDDFERAQLKVHVERFARERRASEKARHEFNRVSGPEGNANPSRIRRRDG